MRRRSGFTLFEVLISLLILGVAILSTIALFPVGIRIASESRYKTLASLKAMDLMHLYSHSLNDVFINDSRDLSLSKDQTAMKIREMGMMSHTRSFDFEQVIMRANSAAIPLPMDIARRLESPNDEIQKVLDQGGLLFYCDPSPFHNTDYMVGMHHARWKGVSIRSMEEYKKLVFAVTGLPQQNALLNHPLQNWPFYEMYPFPPRGALPKIVWQYTLQPAAESWVADDGKTYNHIWTGPEKFPEDINQYQGQNWKFFASERPGSLWALAQEAYDELHYYGWGPAWVKLSNRKETRYDTNRGVTGISKLSDKKVPPLQESPSAALGERIQNDLPDYFALKKLVQDGILNKGNVDIDDKGTPDESDDEWLGVIRPLNAGIADPGILEQMLLESQTHLGATGWDWFFDDEIGEKEDKRLPSMGQRRMYRKLGQELWRVSVEGTAWEISDNDPIGTVEDYDPLTYKWTLEELHDNPELLHPARVLAMSHLAHAAMMVTGMYGPIHGYDDTKFKNSKNQLETNPKRLKDNRYYWASPLISEKDVSDKLPGASTEADGAGKLLAAAQAQDIDRQWAIRAHENSLLFAAAYANLYPYDWCAPRPMNRQMMMDRPLYQVDMFTAGVDGDARRIASNFNTTTEPFYPALGPGYSGFENFWSIYSSDDFFLGPMMQTTDFNRWKSRGTDRMIGAQSNRWDLSQPFEVAERTRQLVFWSVNWLDYEDSETAPSAPIDYSYHRGLDNNPRSNWDHPEMRYAWTGKSRRTTYSGVFNTASQQRGLARSKKSWIGAGQYGADRNNNGTLDKGRVKSGTRLRANEVARFNFYDPVAHMSLQP